MRLFLQNPKEKVELTGAGSMTFLVLQGVGEYDYVPLV